MKDFFDKVNKATRLSALIVALAAAGAVILAVGTWVNAKVQNVKEIIKLPDRMDRYEVYLFELCHMVADEYGKDARRCSPKGYSNPVRGPGE